LNIEIAEGFTVWDVIDSGGRERKKKEDMGFLTFAMSAIHDVGTVRLLSGTRFSYFSSVREYSPLVPLEYEAYSHINGIF